MGEDRGRKGGDLVVPDGFGNYLLANRHNDPKLVRLSHELRGKVSGTRMSSGSGTCTMSSALLTTRTFDWCVVRTYRPISDRADPARDTGPLRNIHPLYGNPDDMSVAHGDDRPIPVELKDRIDIYIEKRSKEKGDRYDSDMLGDSSFNALIRREHLRGQDMTYGKTTSPSPLRTTILLAGFTATGTTYGTLHVYDREQQKSWPSTPRATAHARDYHASVTV